MKDHAMTYRGHIENGAVVLDEPAHLADGARVRVEVINETDDASQVRETPTLYEQLEGVAGTATGLPSDLARNHDHYLHGRPKRS